MKQNIQIILASSILGLKPTGVEKLGQSLIDTGRFDNFLFAKPMIEISNLNEEYSTTRDAMTNCLNTQSIHDFSITLMHCIAEQIDKSSFSIVLGGDCSILIGILPGLKTKGRYGLIFLDAHADFYEPEKSPTGEVADMELAIVTGREPKKLSQINNLQPYVEEKNVVHVGQRDHEETKDYDSQDIQKTAIKTFDLHTIESLGIDKVGKNVIHHMNTLDLDGFWIHFDTDVINDDENPAVDYRLKGGLSFNEVSILLQQLMQTEKIKGMSVTIYNPNLDLEGQVAVKISDCIITALDKNGC